MEVAVLGPVEVRIDGVVVDLGPPKQRALVAGPVDSFLAVAAAATGEAVRAVEHADAAVSLMDGWRLGVGRAWFEDCASSSGSSARRRGPTAHPRPRGWRGGPG